VIKIITHELEIEKLLKQRLDKAKQKSKTLDYNSKEIKKLVDN